MPGKRRLNHVYQEAEVQGSEIPGKRIASFMNKERPSVVLEGRIRSWSDGEISCLYNACRQSKSLPVILWKQFCMAWMQREQVERTTLLKFDILLTWRTDVAVKALHTVQVPIRGWHFANTNVFWGLLTRKPVCLSEGCERRLDGRQSTERVTGEACPL